jgi:DNA-binding transcriptional MerR regulator/methylmalonyl-CoA mutase cobalamin-binding subunit
MYSIKAVSQATGLTVETLRAWERRYAVVAPQRDATGRRVYSPEDVIRLRRLGEATQRGHPIGRLAQLDDDGIAALLNADPATRDDAISHEFVRRILEGAESFAPAQCEQSLTLAIALLPPGELIADVLAPVLHEVGQRWHRGEFSIAQERLVSSSVRRYVGMVLHSYARLSTRAPIVFATLPGERHELGLLVSAMLCASRSHRVHYLGAELPPEEIARYAQRVGAPVVAVSLVLHDNLAGIPAQLQQLVDSLPAQAAVWLGGKASLSLQRSDIPAACVVIRDQLELERRLDLLQTS